MKIIITEEEAYSIVDELKDIKRRSGKLLKHMEELSESDSRSRRHREDDDDDDEEDDEPRFRKGHSRY